MRRRTTNLKLLGPLAVFLCGAMLGAGLGGWIAGQILLLTGQAELERYGHRVLHSAGLVAAETDRILSTVQADGLDFCSVQELTLMRRLVYNASYVKDIGRVADATLYCTTGVGKFTKPGHMRTPDFSVDGRNYYPLIGLAISRKSTGYVVEDHGVSVVLNPESFKAFFEPPKYFSEYLFDPRNHRLLHSFGNLLNISNDEVLSGKPVERDGILIRPMCAEAIHVCVVATESRHDLLARDRPALLGAVVAGTLLGCAMAIILILLHRKQSSLERQLRRAVRKGGLTLAYQPIVNLATGAIVGAEALARWTNEAGETVRPDLFIALAEEQGFVCEITRLVLHRAVEELGDLLAAGNFRVTVNITGRDLKDPDFLSYLDRCLADAGVEPSSVGLELTERSTANEEMSIDAISKLQRAGHTVYIDDFGTGYSSLAYLHQLAADAIKIDRTFTHTVCTEAVTASVVPQILDIARRLDLLVVVEGIETREQAEYFRQAGAGILAQGWLFGAPVPAAEFHSKMAEQPSLSHAGSLPSNLT